MFQQDVSHITTMFQTITKAFHHDVSQERKHVSEWGVKGKTITRYKFLTSRSGASGRAEAKSECRAVSIILFDWLCPFS